MGGIGKTVLAIDLVNDDVIQRAFPDGIFWLTLGQSNEPLNLQSELAGFISGEAQAFATVNEGRDQLCCLFEGKSCLLVLDDLWRPQDAEPFDVLGPRSRLLLTTRDADLLVTLGARELPLDVLSEELALELLASWSGHASATLPPKAVKVVESCGYLPLALALAGARVQGGASWDDVLLALERGRLEFLDHPNGSIFEFAAARQRRAQRVRARPLLRARGIPRGHRGPGRNDLPPCGAAQESSCARRPGICCCGCSEERSCSAARMASASPSTTCSTIFCV